MYSFKQGNFKYNTKNCWFASALIMEANNKTKQSITLEYALDIEQRAYDTFVMPIAGLTIKGGLDRVGKLTESTTRVLTFGSSVFHMYLNNGYLVNCNIIITDTFMEKRNSGQLLDDCTGNSIGSHVLCVCKKDGKYYFVNSWYGDSRDVREFDGFEIGIFKPREKCGILF